MNNALNIEKIEQCFTDYEALQIHHLHLLKELEMPDIARMTSERKQTSDRLQKALGAFTENAGSLGGQKNLDHLTRYEARLGQILDLDETIRIEIDRHRQWLKKSLTRLKHGKTAIQGYKPADAPGTKPRVLSINR